MDFSFGVQCDRNTACSTLSKCPTEIWCVAFWKGNYLPLFPMAWGHWSKISFWSFVLIRNNTVKKSTSTWCKTGRNDTPGEGSENDQGHETKNQDIQFHTSWDNFCGTKVTCSWQSDMLWDWQKYLSPRTGLETGLLVLCR